MLDRYITEKTWVTSFSIPTCGWLLALRPRRSFCFPLSWARPRSLSRAYSHRNTVRTYSSSYFGSKGFWPEKWNKTPFYAWYQDGSCIKRMNLEKSGLLRHGEYTFYFYFLVSTANDVCTQFFFICDNSLSATWEVLVRSTKCWSRELWVFIFGLKTHDVSNLFFDVWMRSTVRQSKEQDGCRTFARMFARWRWSLIWVVFGSGGGGGHWPELLLLWT